MKNGSFLGKKDFDFTEENISYQDENSRGQLDWTAIKSLEENRNAFYLYIDRNIAFIIPKRHFSSQAEETEFKILVQKKLVSTS